MSKTLGVMLYELRSRLDEPVEARWKDKELRTFINEGARELARRAECLRERGTIPVLAGTQDYDAPDDLVRVHHAEFDPNGTTQIFPLEYRDYRAMTQWWGTYQQNQGYVCSFYTTWGFPGNMTIKLYPVPTVAGALNVFYYRQPASLSTSGSADGITIDCPEGWEDLILDWAEWKSFLKDRRPELATVAKARYDELLTAMVETSIRYSDAGGEILYDQTVGTGLFDDAWSVW